MLNKTPISWPEAQRICDIPEVREALDKFAADAHEENMLTMVSAIMGHSSVQGRALEPQRAQKPLSPAMCSLIESGQVEDGDADLVEPQGQTLPVADERPSDCSRDPNCCPQNEGHGCHCSALAAKDKP